MSQTLKHKQNGVLRSFDVYRSGGKLHLHLREWSLTPIGGGKELVVDSNVAYNLADDRETVEHAGDNWDKYAKERFERLNKKRFRGTYDG